MRNTAHLCAPIVIFILLLLAPAAKAGHTDTDLSASLEELTGIWESEGYGHIVEFMQGSHQQFKRYQISDAGCLLIDSGNLEYFYQDLTRVLRNPEYTRFTHMLSGNMTTYAYNRLSELPAACRNDGTPGDRNPLLNFDVLWSTFDEQYAFFDRRGVDWQASRNEFRPQLTSASSDEELFNILAQMITPLCDGHVELSSPFNSFNGAVNPDCWGGFLQHILGAFEQQTEYDDPFTYFQMDFKPRVLATIEEHYLEAGWSSAARGNIIWGDLGGGIGYLSILQMTNYANPDSTPDEDLEVLAPILDEIMDSFAHMDALVIDVRLDTGGYDHVALDIASRFSRQPRVAFTKKARRNGGFTRRSTQLMAYEGESLFTRPIVILTSELTASAAENFLLAMHSLPQVRTVGETTLGVHSDVLQRKLPNGWTFSLSNEVYEAPDGTVFEGRGFKPDIEVVSPRVEHMVMGRDFGIEAALVQLATLPMGPGLNDAWYDPATSGQGFFITVFPDINYVTLAWFTYDTELPELGEEAIFGDPGHRWATALGSIEGNHSVMNIDITSGGLFDTPTEVRHSDPPGSDGTIKLTFHNCESGTIEYEIPTIGRKGTIPIQRVASDNIALCEALNGLSE